MGRRKKALQGQCELIVDGLEVPKKMRPQLSPMQWEQLAKWVEARALRAELRAVQARDLVRQGIGGDALLGQIGYWEACVAVSRKLAFDMRIGNNGPLNLKTPKEPNLD